MQSFERRRRRSDDPITALHYQLSAARSEAQLSALVLVDEGGCLVAGAGAWPLCEELAAYAPLLAHLDAVESVTVGSRLADARLADARLADARLADSRIAALSNEVEIRALTIDGAEALICGHGGGEGRAALLARAAAGCQRILGGAEA